MREGKIGIFRSIIISGYIKQICGENEENTMSKFKHIIRSGWYDDWMKNQLSMNKEEESRMNYYRCLPGNNLHKRHFTSISMMVFSTMIYI